MAASRPASPHAGQMGVAAASARRPAAETAAVFASIALCDAIVSIQPFAANAFSLSVSK